MAACQNYGFSGKLFLFPIKEVNCFYTADTAFFYYKITYPGIKIKVPAQLKDERDEQRILNELVGHFLPERILRTCGEKSLQRYGRELRRYARKHPRLPLKDEDEWIFNNQSFPL